MKIGIDCRLWSESGVGRYIRNLVQGLEKSDSENKYVLFILKKDIAQIQEAVSKDNFTCVIADFRWHGFKEQLLFPFLLYKSRLDLVHFPYFSIPVLYFKPYIITIHDMITWQFATGKASTLFPLFYWLKHFVYRFVVFIGAHKAEKIIAVSKTTQNEIKKYLFIPNSKIVVTYEGVDDFSIKTYRKHIFKDFPSQNFFLAVGNGYPHKNIQRLIEAFARLQIRQNNIALIIVGQENYFLKKLKEFTKEKNIAHVYFTGFVSDTTLALLYQQAKATVIPSLMEGFGLPALEAMKQKCLVAVSDIPVFHEICNNEAFYFNPYRIDDIAKTLENMLSLPKKKQVALKEKAFLYSKNFSWDHMVKETKEIYESCIRI